MSLWIPITLAAALAQAVRFMLQKHLKDTRLSTAGATFSRFVFSAPLVVLLMLAYLGAGQAVVPAPGARFWGFALAGGLSQILATLCVVALFGERNFAVGITLKKTEVLQAALVGFLVLGDTVTPGALAAIGLGFVAVLLLGRAPAAAGGEGGTGPVLFNRAIALGLGSGLLFAFSGIGYRGASLSLATGDPVLRAGLTLAVVTTSQSLGMGAWLAWRAPAQLRAVFAAWRVAALVGLASMVGSFCWFLAFTLQKVAYVKALGQVELLLSIAATVLLFHERITRRELAGMALLLLSILGLLFTI